MTTQHVVSAMIVCVLLAACSRSDSVFSLPPIFEARTTATVASVAECIAARWSSGARHFKQTDANGAIRMRAQTFFGGVTIGVRLTRESGKTRLEYFSRRVANPLYAAMARGCLDAH